MSRMKHFQFPPFYQKLYLIEMLYYKKPKGRYFTSCVGAISKKSPLVSIKTPNKRFIIPLHFVFASLSFSNTKPVRMGLYSVIRPRIQHVLLPLYRVKRPNSGILKQDNVPIFLTRKTTKQFFIV